MVQMEIEKKLRRYALPDGTLPPEVKEANIQKLLQVKPLPKTRGSLWNFILEQIGYQGKYCLLWQLLWLLLFCYLMEKNILLPGECGNEIFALLSLLPPVLVLLTVGEITKVYQRSMLEIEQVTKYSLENVVMIRMLVLCVFHSLILFLGILYLHARADSSLGRLFIYGFTPMILMTGVLLWLMDTFQGEQLRIAGLALYGAAAAFSLLGNLERFNFYDPVYFRIWCLFFGAGLVFEICQFALLQKRLSHIEHMLRYQ